MLTGEVKKLLIDCLNDYLKFYQENMKKVTKETVDEFMKIRKIDAMSEKLTKNKEAWAAKEAEAKAAAQALAAEGKAADTKP